MTKAINPDVTRMLREKFGSPSTVSRKATRYKELFGPMTSNDAYYVLAHSIGIDLSKYLPLSDLDRIRELIPRFPSIPLNVQSEPELDKAKNQGIYPFVTKKTENDARRLGAEIYPLLFVLENSIRELIRIRLAKKVKKWWDTKVPSKVKRSVSYTMQTEQLLTFRQRRGADPLFYTNFRDLKLIVDANQSYFVNDIYDFEWFRVWMDEIYMVRNNIAHCVPLTREDSYRITIFHNAWARMFDPVNRKP